MDSFFVARGRALAAYARGKRDRATLQELQQLRDEAARVGFKRCRSTSSRLPRPCDEGRCETASERSADRYLAERSIYSHPGHLLTHRAGFERRSYHRQRGVVPITPNPKVPTAGAVRIGDRIHVDPVT